MLPSYATRREPLPTVLFLSNRSADAFELKRRLGDTARLVVRSCLGDPQRLLRGVELGPSDSLVIDQRDALPAHRRAFHALVSPERMCCRVLVLDAPRNLKASFDLPWNALTVGTSELTTAFAAAVHYGNGRHGLLIEAMQALLPPLSPLGRQFVSEVLASRFLLHRVAAIAGALGVHRTRLHRRLVAAGDPSPKRLLDACYAISTVMMVRDPTYTTKDLLRFVRAVELRTPRDAVRRSTGMDLSSLRLLARRDRGRTASSLILMQLMGEVDVHKECRRGPLASLTSAGRT